MKINKYKKDDISDEIKKTIDNIFSENEVLELNQAYLYSDCILTLELDNQIIGYCTYKYNPNPPYKGVYVNQIALSKAYQNNNYGIQFYKYIEKEEDCDIYCHINNYNIQSIRFHNKLGFNPIESETNDDNKKMYVKRIVIR